MAANSKVLDFISGCNQPERLQVLISNARSKGDKEVADCAFRRLISLVPSEAPGSVEYDFWRTINAFEFALTEERGRTTRLSRTRQKVARVGVLQTLRDWAVSSKKTDGFSMLLERGMPELTGEAIILRHPSRFETAVVAAARARLAAEDVNIEVVSAH